MTTETETDSVCISGITISRGEPDWTTRTAADVPTMEALPNAFYRKENAHLLRAMRPSLSYLHSDDVDVTDATKHVWLGLRILLLGDVLFPELVVWVGRMPLRLGQRDWRRQARLTPAADGTNWELGVYPDLCSILQRETAPLHAEAHRFLASVDPRNFCALTCSLRRLTGDGVVQLRALCGL